MPRHVTCAPDGFAAAVTEMIAVVFEAADAGMEGAVKAACKVGTSSAKEHASSASGSSDGMPDYRQGRALTPGKKYVSGFRHNVDKDGKLTKGTIYNSKAPGLVHLLEKGHARVGGGRVQSYVHFADAADDAFDELERQVDKAIEEALNA